MEWLTALGTLLGAFVGAWSGNKLARWGHRRWEARIAMMGRILTALQDGPAPAPTILERLAFASAIDTGRAGRFSVRRLYPLLRELERKKLVTSYEEPGREERKGRPWTVYSLRLR